MVVIVTSCVSQLLSERKPCFEVGENLVVLNMPANRRAKLGQIQGGLQRAIKESTNNFLLFYALKMELFRVFTLSDYKRPTFKNFTL